MIEEKIKKIETDLKIILYGVGSINSDIARLLLQRKSVRIVGAFDSDPSKIGHDLGLIIGLKRELGLKIKGSKDFDFSVMDAEVAVHATSSFLHEVYPQLEQLIDQGINIISTCEELSNPEIIDKKIATKLDDLAKGKKVTILGAGINPGFLMDVLPLFLTTLCQKIECIKVKRVIDASKRRIPFQKKIGVGLTVREFRKMIKTGKITGHVGLKQSISSIAETLNWELEKLEISEAEPIIIENDVRLEFSDQKCIVAGIKQFGTGSARGKTIIRLEFYAYINADEEFDAITIKGIPMINEKITPCIHGDIGTVAIIVNLIPQLSNLGYGLKTMRDIFIPSASLYDLRSQKKSR